MSVDKSKRGSSLIYRLPFRKSPPTASRKNLNEKVATATKDKIRPIDKAQQRRRQFAKRKAEEQRLNSQMLSFSDSAPVRKSSKLPIDTVYPNTNNDCFTPRSHTHTSNTSTSSESQEEKEESSDLDSESDLGQDNIPSEKPFKKGPTQHFFLSDSNYEPQEQTLEEGEFCRRKKMPIKRFSASTNLSNIIRANTDKYLCSSASTSPPALSLHNHKTSRRKVGLSRSSASTDLSSTPTIKRCRLTSPKKPRKANKKVCALTQKEVSFKAGFDAIYPLCWVGLEEVLTYFNRLSERVRFFVNGLQVDLSKYEGEAQKALACLLAAVGHVPLDISLKEILGFQNHFIPGFEISTIETLITRAFSSLSLQGFFKKTAVEKSRLFVKALDHVEASSITTAQDSISVFQETKKSLIKWFKQFAPAIWLDIADASLATKEEIKKKYIKYRLAKACISTISNFCVAQASTINAFALARAALDKSILPGLFQQKIGKMCFCETKTNCVDYKIGAVEGKVQIEQVRTFELRKQPSKGSAIIYGTMEVQWRLHCNEEGQYVGYLKTGPLIYSNEISLRRKKKIEKTFKNNQTQKK